MKEAGVAAQAGAVQHRPELAGSARQLGNVAPIREDSRDMWMFTFWERLGKDVRYGVLATGRNKLFTIMAVLSLALGIGANTAVCGVMDAVMLRALPVRNPGELVILKWRAKGDPEVIESHNGSNYDEPGGYQVSPDFPWPAYEPIRDRVLPVRDEALGSSVRNVCSHRSADASRLRPSPLPALDSTEPWPT